MLKVENELMFRSVSEEAGTANPPAFPGTVGCSVLGVWVLIVGAIDIDGEGVGYFVG